MALVKYEDQQKQFGLQERSSSKWIVEQDAKTGEADTLKLFNLF